MAFCSKCGAHLDPTWKSCPHCGHKIIISPSNDEINRLIDAFSNRHCNRLEIHQHKKISKRARKEWLSLNKEIIIERATELSKTGIPTLESVKIVIKESEDKQEEAYKKSIKGGSPILGYITIWAILTFLLALAINLAFWGAVLSRLGRGYWETLFSDGLWTFLVGGFGAIMIMVFFNEM